MTTDTLKICFPSQEKALVRVNIRYPVTDNERINRYIYGIVNAMQSFAAGRLASQASKENENVPFSLVATCKSVNESEDIFSFWFDVFVCRGGEKSRIRRIPLNFDRKKGCVIFPSDIYPRCVPRVPSDAASFGGRMYADCEKAAIKHYKRKNTVIAPNGIYATYDSGILAPHSVGALCLPMVPSTRS